MTGGVLRKATKATKGWRENVRQTSFTSFPCVKNSLRLLAAVAFCAKAWAVGPARIEVVEQGSGWPVPAVELRTTGQQRFVTDNAGVIALDAPDLLGREVWFSIHGHGYQVPGDGFGYRGVRIRPEAGGTNRVEVRRTIVARRLGRVTGAGLFAESQRFGNFADVVESGVVGCDSVQNAVHRGRLFWAWGDTTVAAYPLGIFEGTGATTSPKPIERFEPPLRLPLEWLRDARGRPRAMAPIGGEGPTWITGMTSVPDQAGTPRLVCSYLKVRPPMELHARGLAVWDEAASVFRAEKVVWTKSSDAAKEPLFPEGHANPWRDASGREWLLFGNPFPSVRCPATFEAWRDPSTWERLVPQAVLKDAATGAEVKPHSGSIAWHPWRKRWVTVFVQSFGKPSAFGEVWYAEADAPTGPWGPAVKILGHDNYTFYNPAMHPEFVADGAPMVVFEGTFSKDFADHAEPVPRHDYNQMMYRLDLDDPRLKPAQAR